MVSDYADAGQERWLANAGIDLLPGLRELDGLWTNREATAMKAHPRRLLVLGGGPVGVEIAQAVGRLGGEAVLAREPAALGEAVGEVLRRDGIELVLGARATGARRDGDSEAAPRVTYTDPQAAAVGATEAAFSATALVLESPRPPPTRAGSRSAASSCAPHSRSAVSSDPPRSPHSPCTFMTNTALTGATYDIDGGQQLI
jgi:pyruvate/2-oxoglutarate dehydrogenase complex dihydrolipoamide dehydrogenase (E3) component